MSHTPEAGRDSAYVGISIRIQGEIHGQEDLFINGEVEGNILLPNQRLIVGPNANIRGQISAREVSVLGKVRGNIRAQNRLEILKTGWVEGELSISRIAIEDGAFFKGSIAVVSQEQPAGAAAAGQSKSEPKTAAGGTSSPSSGTAAAATQPPQTPAVQSSWLERKP